MLATRCYTWFTFTGFTFTDLGSIHCLQVGCAQACIDVTTGDGCLAFDIKEAADGLLQCNLFRANTSVAGRRQDSNYGLYERVHTCTRR